MHGLFHKCDFSVITDDSVRIEIVPYIFSRQCESLQCVCASSKSVINHSQFNLFSSPRAISAIYASFIQIYLVTNFTRLSAAGKKIPSFYGSINPGRVRSGSYQDISAAVIAFPTIASRRRNARPSNNVRRPGQAENFI